MKNLVSAVLLSCLILCCSNRALGANAKNDPSNFPLVVHVSASAFAPEYSPAFETIDTLREIVTATINGKHYQLEGPTSGAQAGVHRDGLLNPGDYHAKLTRDDHITSYESSQRFEILFPDGTTRPFDVIAQSE